MATTEVPIRIALAGLGMLGRQHARILSSLDGVEFVGACDISSQVRQELVPYLHGGTPIVTTWAELIALRPGAVVNALPTHLHYESTKLFLDAGLDVLVEKPIASDVAEGTEMVKLAQNHGAVFMVGHVERFNGAVQALKHEIDKGTLGEIISVVARRVGVARPVAPHANVALDLAIHDVDVVRYLLGRPAELVTAFGRAIGTNTMEDHVDLVLRYGDTFCTVQANWITPVKVRRLNVTGTKGTAELDYIGQTIRLWESEPELVKGQPWDFFAVSQESKPRQIFVEKSEPLRAELDHFVACVRGRSTPAVPASEACAALAIVVEATERLRLGY